MPTISYTAIQRAYEEHKEHEEERETDYNESLYANRYETYFRW